MPMMFDTSSDLTWVYNQDTCQNENNTCPFGRAMYSVSQTNTAKNLNQKVTEDYFGNKMVEGDMYED